MAVNRPTDPKQKEYDINNKLQLYGIYSAFANGKVPSNTQIDIAMNSALNSKALSSPSPKLSSEGRELVADLKKVVEEAKILLLSKNEDNLLQDFIWQTQHLGSGDATKPGAPIDKATAKQHGNEALEGLRTLGTLLITNGQFRKLLNDASILLRDIAGDAATSVAGRVNPNEDQLAQIDHAAEDNTWHDAPDIQGMKSQAKSTFNKNKPFDREGLQLARNEATQATTGSSDPNDAANVAADGNVSKSDAATGATAGLQNLRDQTSANVPDETKDKAREKRDQLRAKSKNYLSSKMPKERREQTIWRLKKMVIEIQGHSDYQQAIETLLGLAETYAGHGRDLSSQGVGTVKGARSDEGLQAAEADLRTLIERFANSTSADDLFESINNIYRDAEKDPELKKWFQSVDKYIRKCLQEQGFIMQDAANEEWNELYDHGRYLLRERYRDHTNRVIDEFKFMGDQFDKDPQNQAFGQAVQKLFLDLGNDENGKPVFKKHLVKDLSQVILPAIFENVRYVPIPRIEVSDPMIDAVIENLVIESDNLMPNVFEFGSDNYFRWGRKKISNKHDNKVMIAVSGVQMDLKDVSYYIKKKQGFPSVTDKGIMDIFLGGDGLSFKIAASTVHKADRNHFFKVDTVSVNVKNLDIKLKQSNHKTLFGIFKPLLFRVARPAIQKVLEKQIKDSFNQMDAYAYDIHLEAEKAAEATKNDPENAQNIYNRYATAAQKKMTANKKKADAKAKDVQTNVAMTHQDSIFPNIKLPGGISTKATEYKEMAAKGEKWESPVFSIGSGKESTNIPMMTPVSRKPHNAANGGVRGGDNIPNGTTGGY